MVQVFSESFECKVSSKRMWHGLFKDAHNCLPKALPSKVHSVEYPLGQHGFDFPGAERIIKFHKEVSEEAHKSEELLHKEEGLVKAEGKKIDEEVHKEALLAKEKEEEAAVAVEKEAGEVKEEVEKVGGEAEKEVHHVKEGLGGALHKGVKYIKGVVGGAAHEAGSVTEKVLEKEKEEAHKSIKAGEKVVHKEEEEVGGALHKVEDFFKKEELWVKEKIEEVEYEASKITIHVVAGGLIGILFKHYKHTFELKEKEAHGSILHWTCEFETVSSSIHIHHSFDKLKEHVLEPFYSVEAYLLKHEDYY